ncbi:MAG: hypothetical protein FJ026_10255 [Chloroflexi bacterium]|nr:hypothetical protein [Chloroflexota bacterium]
MKMIMAVVPKEEANCVINDLVDEGLTATFAESRGGVLRHASNMLFIVAEDNDLDKVLSIIGRSCHSCVSLEKVGAAGETLPSSVPLRAEVGGAVVFVWELQGLYRY